MSASRTAILQEQLIQLGYPKDLPVGLIENASHPTQRSFRCTLAELPSFAEQNKVKNPTTIVIGHVVDALSTLSSGSDAGMSQNEREMRQKAAYAARLVYEAEQDEKKKLLLSQPVPPDTDSLRSDESIGNSSKSVLSIPAEIAAANILPARMIDLTDEHLVFVNKRLADRTLPQVLQWCCDTLPGLAQVSSFGVTGLVILDALDKMGETMPCIFLDTLYHFDETLEHTYRVEKHFRLDVLRYSCQQAATREEFERLYGAEMWKSDAAKYDYLVKVEPLERALRENKVKAWITGRRRDQGDARSDLDILEFDLDGRLKVNPLAHWGWDQVWGYIRHHNVPYNPLHDKKYKSVGDAHSTVPVGADGKERSGRFVGQQEADNAFRPKTECGIHNRWKYVVQRGSSC
eukprot:TRINITY_DN3691_c1_g1_i2.p1 TRINITY_DN3691_c1_g1~~TRINITY_DN3691_c1_g1_i2.p1  ORF type:complete len:404 (-),score=66.89 TRINITY_DN3691_c1_g1_i2:165-1376(-)